MKHDEMLARVTTSGLSRRRFLGLGAAGLAAAGLGAAGCSNFTSSSAARCSSGSRSSARRTVIRSSALGVARAGSDSGIVTMGGSRCLEAHTFHAMR